MTIYGDIGTISHATLRNEDLLEAFSDELERLGKLDAVEQNSPENAGVNGTFPGFAQWLDAQNHRDKLIEDARTIDPDHEDATELVLELMDALNEYAPPYCYFGAIEGDGSDFGFWPCMESVEELPKLSDPCEVSKYAGEDCAFVNDHGNVTVYDGSGKVIWNIV